MSPRSFLRITLTVFVILASFSLFSQVTGVNYQIRFNPTNCLYEARLIINSGSATTALQRAQFSAQYSIVVPTTSTLNLVTNHMPLQNNQTYGGTQPTIWFVSSYIQNPAASPGNDFYSVTPSLTPTSFYNNLQAGDTVRLFSFSVDPLPSCGFGVRPFENGVDPGSGAQGMGGGDFTNGFTIGGPAQKYEGNTPAQYGLSPSISLFEPTCTQGLGIALNASISGCQSPLSFEWSGPLDYSSTSQSVSIPDANHLNNGNYQVVISDNIGCTDTLEITAFAKPEAGPDQIVNCYLTGQATIATSGPGLWSISNQSAGTATISSISDPVITVSGFSVPGNYYIIKSLNNCSDTIVINTGNNCACGITNVLQQPLNNTFCGQSGSIQLSGNDPGLTGNFLWQYKMNNQPFVNASGTNNFQNYNTPSLDPGTHTFRRIFSKSGGPECTDTSNQIVILVGIQPEAGSNHQLNCHENTSVSMNATGEGFWYLGTGSAGTLQITSVTNPTTIVNNFSNPGNYYLVWANMYCSDTTVITIQNLCGCDFADGGPDKSVCAGTKTNLQGNCSIGTWASSSSNPPGSSLILFPEGAAQVIFGLNAQGLYKYIYSISESLTDTVQIIVSPIPVIDAGQDFDYCEGSQAVTIVAGGAQSYIWSTGQTGSSITVSPTESTLYIVTGTNNAGCSAMDSIQISVLPKPDGNIPTQPPCYENDNMQLFAGQWSNALLYQWSGPMNFNSMQQNPVIPDVTLQHSGTYYLTVTSPDDCINTASVNIEILQRPLPVHWLSLEGSHIPEKGLNQIVWATAAERNNAEFIVEKSLDGILFSEISKVKGAGSSHSEQHYSVYDHNIISGGIYYYRIKQTDFDGKFQWSPIVSVYVPVKKETEEFTVELYPNPAKDYCNLILRSSDIEHAEFRIINVDGLIVYIAYFEKITSGQNIAELVNFENFNSGIYTLVVVSNQRTWQKKLILQK